MSWVYLILASILEICWFYCISYLNRNSFKELYTFSFLEKEGGWLTLVALVGYVVFGVMNAIFFTKSIQKINASVGFAVWTGLALAGISILDALFFQVHFSITQLSSILLILVGVIGIKIWGDKA